MLSTVPSRSQAISPSPGLDNPTSAPFATPPLSPDLNYLQTLQISLGLITFLSPSISFSTHFPLLPSGSVFCIQQVPTEGLSEGPQAFSLFLGWDWERDLFCTLLLPDQLPASGSCS